MTIWTWLASVATAAGGLAVAVPLVDWWRVRRIDRAAQAEWEVYLRAEGELGSGGRGIPSILRWPSS